VSFVRRVPPVITVTVSGPQGIGKTTIINALTNFLERDSPGITTGVPALGFRIQIIEVQGPPRTPAIAECGATACAFCRVTP
jgi:ABC-type branched-subunit amino acid transport system ATPase component